MSNAYSQPPEGLPCEASALLAELRAILARQQDCLQHGQMVELLAGVHKSQQLIERLGNIELPPESVHELRQLGELIAHAQLSIASQMDDVSAKLSKLRQGRHTLRAYRNGN